MSNATEAGTSDFLAIRHVNLVRYSDDLQTIVPNVAKGWEWNDDFTQLTFFLRKGHKWSDGHPFHRGRRRSTGMTRPGVESEGFRKAEKLRAGRRTSR